MTDDTNDGGRRTSAFVDSHNPPPERGRASVRRDPRARATRSTRTTALAVVGALALVTVWSATPTVNAAPEDFYTPPSPIPAEPGAIIETEPMAAEQPGTPTRVMYSSRLQDGTPAAVTGTYLDPAVAWTGPGPRPTVVIGPGTLGQGDQCATSLGLSQAVAAATNPSGALEEHLPEAARWSGLGARIFITDYIGLGTPGIHTYANRLESAHALLDGARAAHHLAGVDDHTPLLLWGYSQGGGATAAAAELQPRYAPELNLKGTWAGAPVADPQRVLERVDGVLIGGVLGFALNGLSARYRGLDTELDAILSPSGRAVLDTLSTECIGDVIAHHPFLRSRSLTIDALPLSAHLPALPVTAAALADQRVGTLAPSAPVLITSARNDDTVPYDQALALARDWCAQGAAITLRTNEMPPLLPGATLPNHYGPQILDSLGPDNPIAFLLDRLADRPVSDCVIN